MRSGPARGIACIGVLALLMAVVAGLVRDALPAAAAVSGANDLAGAWRITVSSRFRLLVFSPFRRFRDKEHLIVLNTHGSCQFRSHWQYSYIDANETEEDAYFDTDDCEWRMGRTGVRRDGVLSPEPSITLAIRQGEKAIDTVYLIGMRGDKVTLWQRIGEPWMSLYMEFEQQR